MGSGDTHVMPTPGKYEFDQRHNAVFTKLTDAMALLAL